MSSMRKMCEGWYEEVGWMVGLVADAKMSLELDFIQFYNKNYSLEHFSNACIYYIKPVLSTVTPRTSAEANAQRVYVLVVGLSQRQR